MAGAGGLRRPGAPVSAHGPAAIRVVVDRMRAVSPDATYDMLRPAAEALIGELGALRLLVLDTDSVLGMAASLRRLAGELVAAPAGPPVVSHRLHDLAAHLAGVADGLVDMVREVHGD